MRLTPQSCLSLSARFAWGLLALTALLAVGCASDPPDEPVVVPAGTRENGMLVLTQADNGRGAEVRIGERIAVRLPENRTTGHVWAIDETNRQLLALDGTYFEEPEEGFIGARGTRGYTFTARQAGKVDLKFKYWRVWGGEGSVTERFGVTLHIIKG